jgi:hypothetical protein
MVGTGGLSGTIFDPGSSVLRRRGGLLNGNPPLRHLRFPRKSFHFRNFTGWVNWLLLPVEVRLWDLARAIRMDAPKRERLPFDPDEFERMTPEQADQYERRVLGACCPEVGFHRDGSPD